MSGESEVKPVGLDMSPESVRRRVSDELYVEILAVDRLTNIILQRMEKLEDFRAAVESVVLGWRETDGR